MTNSLRLDGGENSSPGSKSQDCITGSSQTLHDLNHSLCEYVMSLQCDKGAIHQIWEGRTRCHNERRPWVRMTDRISVSAEPSYSVCFAAKSLVGHVWTAPWQELSDVFCSIGRVRSRVRPVGAASVAAGPNALRGSGPKQTGALRRSALTQAGSPDPRNDRICITSSCPRQLVPIYLLACLMPPATVSAPYISRREP